MPWPMDDERAIELYREFRNRLRNEVGIQLETTPYARQFTGEHFHLAGLFHEVAQVALRELANALNEFRRYLKQLDAWRPIYAGLSQDEQRALLMDHIRPLAVLSLTAPYSIRGRIIHASD